MSRQYAEHNTEKLQVVPLVHSTTHPNITDDVDSPAGAMVALDGAPVNGGVPTYNAGTSKHTSVVPTGGSAVDQALASALAVEAEARLRIDGIATTTTTDASQAVAAALAAEANARLFDATITIDEQQVVLLSQFYGA